MKANTDGYHLYNVVQLLIAYMCMLYIDSYIIRFVRILTAVTTEHIHDYYSAYFTSGVISTNADLL